MLTSAAERPLLVVLDDLHAADALSLLLTRFIADRCSARPVVIVGAYRTSGADGRPEVQTHLDALVQHGSEIRLGPLSVDELTEMIGADELASEVHRISRGNPLFAQQIMRSKAVDTSGPPGTDQRPPEEILRKAIEHRIANLEDGRAHVLLVLAVLNSRASLDEVALVAGSGGNETAPVLTELVDQGLALRHLDGNGSGFEIAHPLVGEAAHSWAPDALCEEMHGRAAEWLDDDPDRVGELAHHLLRAGPAARAAAIEACMRAASQANTLAGEDSVGLLSHALDALDSSCAPIPDADRLRLRILLELGRALRIADRVGEADEIFARAAPLAKRLGDADGVGLAALRGGVQYFFRADLDGGTEQRCREALEMLGNSDGALQARLCADLSAHLFRSDEVEPSRAMADDSVAMARRVGDPGALGYALIAQQMSNLGPTTLARRAASAREIMALSRRVGDPNLAVQGRFFLLNALIEQGDIRGLDDAVALPSGDVGNLADRNHARFTLWLACTRALLAGDADRAEEVANQLLAQSIEAGEPYALRVFGVQLVATRWVQGRMLETEAILENQARLAPNEPGWVSALAYLRAADQRADEARADLERMGDLDAITDGMHWLGTMATAGEAAARVGDDRLVAEYWERLLPYSDRFVSVNVGASVWAAVARSLGLLALRLGHVDEGLAHLERAVAVCARLGARPWLVEAKIELAAALRVTGRDDNGRASELAGEARTAAQELDLGHFLERAEVILDGEGRQNTVRFVPTAPRQPAISVLGTFEVASVDGEVARWSSRKARELVKILVARRGSPVHREVLMDLLWPGDDPASLGNRLSVALSTVRRALDPDRRFATHDLLASEGSAVWLRLDRVEVDVERFLSRASSALAAHDADQDDAERLLTDAFAAHRGPALPDEPYAEWASPLQSEVNLVHLRVLEALAGRAIASGDGLTAAQAFARLVEADPLDPVVHDGLVDALERIGAVGLAAAERRRYRRSIASS